MSSSDLPVARDWNPSADSLLDATEPGDAAHAARLLVEDALSGGSIDASRRAGQAERLRQMLVGVHAAERCQACL